MPQAGSSIRQLAQQRRNKAFVQFASAGVLAIAPFIIAPFIGTAGLKVLVFAICLGTALFLVNNGLKLSKKAKNADLGAKGEETVALLLRELEAEGWQVEPNIPIPKWGDVDFFVRSPNSNCFAIDTKSHGGTVFFNGVKLMRRFGQEVYEFEDNKDFLKAARGQAAAIRDLKGAKYVTPILCFTKAELDIQTVDNLVEKVYVIEHESLVRGKLNLCKSMQIQEKCL